MRALATIALVLLTACPGTKSIKELLNDPGKYDGQVVRIAGDVTGSVGALGYGVYQVSDGTGNLSVVVAGGGATPRVGAKVGVEGTFKSAFTLGTTTVAVLLEKQRKVK